jgi:carbonic anhydrase/acetyltransferase-like protein (isoleucine patch superfamily)
MAQILPFNNCLPDIHESAWVAEDAVITGKVSIDAFSSVFYKTVIRGDVNNIIIGSRTNIQDHTMIHGSYKGRDTVIGDDVTIGHRAIIHGCEIQSNSLIGMGAIILDNTVVEEHVVVGAGSLVTMGKVLKSGFLYAGVPARRIKALDAKMIEDYIIRPAAGYVNVSQAYKLGN